MGKFIVQDWNGNILFEQKEFESSEDAQEHIYEKLQEDEIEDVFVVEKEAIDEHELITGVPLYFRISVY